MHNPGLYRWAEGIKECFSDGKIQKYEMPTKYAMKIYSKRHSISPGITVKTCENGKVAAQ
jgi:hypothetical protein